MFTALFFGVLFTLVVARFELIFKTPFLEQGDFAVNALQIREAKHFAEIYGNYSRFEFNHPGPAFFYVYAAAEWLLHDVLSIVPSPGSAHLLAGLCLQSLFFATALTLLATHLPWRSFLPLALFFTAVYFGWHREALVSIWPPHVLPMPFLCFLVVCTSVAVGRVRLMPLMVLVGGFLVHGHVAQPLFVGSLGALALVLAARRLRVETSWRWREILSAQGRIFAVCGLILLVFLLPFGIDLVTRGARSNLATIFGRIVANTQESVSAFQSFLYFISYPVASREQSTVFTTLGPQTWIFLREHGGRIAFGLAILVLPTSLVIARRPRLTAEERRFFLTASAMLAVALVGCLLWGMAQAGGMHHYNGYFYHSIYFFALLLGLALFARWLDPFQLTALNAVVCVAALAVGVNSFRARSLPPSERGLSIQEGVAAALAADPDHRPKLLGFEPTAWHIAAGVALELTRRDIGFYTAPWWSYMFQRRHDSARLGAHLDERVTLWWIAPKGPGGVPITRDLAIYTSPAALDPEGGVIAFRKEGNGFRYLGTGVTAGNRELMAANERRAWLRFSPRPATHDVRITFDAQADNVARTSTPAEIFFNGESLGRIAVAARSKVSVTVPAAQWNRAALGTLELRFPEAVPHRSSVRPDYEWWSSWQLWEIQFESAR